MNVSILLGFLKLKYSRVPLSRVLDEVSFLLLHMFFLCFVVSALGLLSRAVAQSASSNWVVPDGTQADYAQTFINGSQLPVAWTGWNSTFTESMLHSSVTVANLWVTKVTSSDVFSQLLAGVC